MKQPCVFLICLIFFFSCQPVRFNKPVPLKATKLQEFPDSLIGSYYVADSMFMNDSDAVIYNGRYFADIYKYKDSADILELDITISKYAVEIETYGRSYYDSSKTDWARFSDRKDCKMEGKYIIINDDRMKDTIVNLKDKDILKSMNGNFYLNIYYDKNDWETYQLVCLKDNMLAVNIINRDNLQSLPEKFKTNFTFMATTIKNVNERKFKYLLDHQYFEKYLTIKKYPL